VTLRRLVLTAQRSSRVYDFLLMLPAGLSKIQRGKPGKSSVAAQHAASVS
jgi:hypothetical protein